ncbi:MAG: M14 family zinc carboxypeptidase, partial [Acidobacteriota bacterium]
ARSTPAIVWLAFGIHGNESSSAEAAMQVANTLLNDPASAKILENCVVLIDPLQNPDGRERYIQWFKRTRGAVANPAPEAFEHSEPWPGGRYNHYLIDMNRDWTWSSQRETQARIALYRQWNPQVFVDFHEMSWQSSYFFPPDAKPINLNLPKDVERWLEVFGKQNAAAFTARGWPFFVSETFDLFYPGYGDSWPSLHGAVGMTYEVAGGGGAGSAIRREDATLLTLADRIARHYTTGMTTLRTAADHREELLRYTNEAMRQQADTGRNTFLLLPGSPNFDDLLRMLERQSVRVGMLTAPLTIKATRIEGDAAESRTFPAGTAVISTHQPLGGLAQTLLEKSATFTKGFLEEQRAKTEADESDNFYDLTTWSLPLAMNVEAYTTATPLTAEVKPYTATARATFRPASYGYLVDGNDPNVYRLAGRMLSAGMNFNIGEDVVETGERTFARGTLIILKGNNKGDVDAVLEGLARETGVTPFPLESGWMGGTAFGSERIHYVRDPKIALVGGAGTGASSFGMLWHTLDIDTPIPHTNLSLDSLGKTNLDHFRVIVLPDGESYAERLGKKGVAKLQDWIRGGGTLVAIKTASSFLRDKDVELSKIKPWEPAKPKGDDVKQPPLEERYNDYRIPGSAFRTTMNARSYLTFGVPRPPAVLLEGGTALLPVSHRVDNVVTLDAKNPLISGVAWPESIERLKGSVYLVTEPYGRGNVITFADEPHFRLFWRGTLPLFLNAVLYSPSFPRD